MSNNKEREAFERAILNNPDDTAGYAAYADWLQEHDDPRGEFIATQLALEDENRPKAERKKLQARETELLAAHEREWLGGLAGFVFEEHTTQRTSAGYVEDYSTETQVLWERGIPSGVIVGRLSTALAQTLALDPAAQFVRELRVNDTMHGYYGGPGHNQPAPRVKTPEGIDQHLELFELLGSPFLANLRVFQLGNEIPPEDGWCDCHTIARGLEHFLAGMSRVEVLELYCKDYDTRALFQLPNLTHLRELRAYHVGTRLRGGGDREYEYPLDVLAANPALANLTHLLFHPHWAEEGDGAGEDRSYIPLGQVRALVRSPNLPKLTHLQLRLSDMGDAGVREIVASGILKRLKWLDLRHGCITDAGAKLFAECPDAKNLERLDLSRNAVTAAGLAVLRKAKVNAVANRPLTDAELESREYLREGDFE